MYTVYKERRRKRKRWGLILGILLFLMLMTGAVYYLLSHYEVKNVYVDGNVHYSSEEIRELVMGGPLGGNSLYLSFKYKNKDLKGIPFIDTIRVSILSPDTIRISVYEKALAGFVEYLGKYMYFDKDGTVVESSDVKTVGIAEITGLSFEYVVLGKPLPVENEQIFKQILNTSHLLTKYGLTADKLYFDAAYNMTIYFGNVRVNVGNDELLDEKIMLLPQMLPTLEGKNGVLRMENYSDNTGSITFEPDVEESATAQEEAESEEEDAQN